MVMSGMALANAFGYGIVQIWIGKEVYYFKKEL